MTKKNKLSRQKRLAIAGFFAIFIALLFLISSVPATAGAGQNQLETGMTTTSYIPNPTLNSNVTWSTFYHNWKPLEYSNGTANLTLNAQENTLYGNPITLNPSDIVAKGTLQNNKIGGAYWNASTANIGNTAPGEVYKIGTKTVGGATQLWESGNQSAAGGASIGRTMGIPTTDYLSNNLAYDFLTIGAYLPAGYPTGTDITLQIANTTATGTILTTTTWTSITSGETFYNSIPLSSLQKELKIGLSPINGKNYTPKIHIQFKLEIPAGTTDFVANGTIYAVALTTNQLSLGTETSNGITNTLSNTTRTAQLSDFSPTFNFQSVVNSGYKVAISQTMQNITESQSSITSGSYIEQATYQGIFSLPTAPDLSYSNSKISMNMTIPGTQFEVANLNGISYLSQIQTKTNGTFTFGTVNPNQQNAIILETKFTASQWNASTSAPSFFSIQGLEYYWWVGLIGLMSVIGLGAAASSHFSGEEENLRIPKGKFGR